MTRLMEALPPVDIDNPGGEDDAVLVARARHDPQAFAPLYARYARPVYRYCYRRLGSHEAAEDAASQIFLKALASLPRYRDGTFRSWLFTIAHNVITDSYRRQWPEANLDQAAAVPDPAHGPEDLLLGAEAQVTVQQALQQLRPEQRRVVELRLAGLTGPEIAQVLARRPEAVKSIQFRAYARLRGLLAAAMDRQETRITDNGE